MTEAIADLLASVEEFLAAHSDTVISASRTINPLLVLWELAVLVDPSVAAPVEMLLTVLVHRELTTPAELAHTAAEIRAAIGALEMAVGV